MGSFGRFYSTVELGQNRRSKKNINSETSKSFSFDMNKEASSSSSESKEGTPTTSSGASEEVRDTIDVGRKIGFNMDGCEAKTRNLLLNSGDGNRECDFDVLDAHGKYGGILLVWDPSFFKKITVVKGDCFLVVCGSWAGCAEPCGFINVYAPQSIGQKKELWSNLLNLITSHTDVSWVIFGDFNEARR
ncbi:hypothetical protein OSB04_un000951 [Centaurea solstitialis]|uniref:RNA-directed DNA polymerase, eukaryota n=1 Tax=Centaurea solstitialis TaxID=347529 RepID=A0AA38W254_9ASTR|nr:hypothetical protein OSB04_un000951 [Centaurea solstitialis]